MDGAPPEWSLNSKDGNIGLFIGLPPNLPDNVFDENTFKLLNIKLMRPSELLYCIENDNNKEGRVKLAELYVQQEKPTVTNLEREAVV
jgi:hypothetical protein